jgi:cell wall-associated NlpC family hydrolase
MGASERDIVVALAVASQESHFQNYANDGTDPRLEADQRDVSRSLQLPHDAVGRDHGSVGEFQQQYPWWGSLEELMTPAIGAQKFFAKLLVLPGRDQMAVTVAAQTVQQSNAPAAYADDESVARGLYAQLKDTASISPSIKVGDATAGAATPGGGCGAPTGAGGVGPVGVLAHGLTLTLPAQAAVAGTLTFPTPVAATAAAAALSYVGTAYAWGGGGPGGPSPGLRDGGVADSFGDYPKAGFDCSSLVQYGYAAAGIDITRSTGSQWESGGAGPHYAYTDALPGDLIYYGSPTHHVGMYLGSIGGRQLMVEAPQSGDVVKVSTVRTAEIVGVARPTAQGAKP